MNRGTYFRTTSKCVFAFLLAISTIAFVQITRGQGKQTTTTVSSSKYGAGGTEETTSDDKLRVLKEIWKDKSGQVRELHVSTSETIHQEPEDEGKIVHYDEWMFINKNGTVAGQFRYFPAPEPYFLNLRSMLREKIFGASKAKVEEWIEEIEKQFAEDGTIIDPTRPKKKEDEGDTKFEPPKLPDEKKKENEAGTKVDPPKPPVGGPTPSPGPKVATGSGTSIDPCLVGKWVSGTSTTLNGSSGMSGIHLVISANRSVTVTYDGMRPLNTIDSRGKTVGSDSWSGEASGQIATANSQIVVTNKAASSVVWSSTLNGITRTNKVDSLAPVLPGAPDVLSYTCGNDALVITTTVNGLKLFEFHFTKEK